MRSVVQAPAGKAFNTILMLSMDMIAEVLRQVWWISTLPACTGTKGVEREEERGKVRRTVGDCVMYNTCAGRGLSGDFRENV